LDDNKISLLSFIPLFAFIQKLPSAGNFIYFLLRFE